MFQFHEPAKGRKVWCAPVSTYGFVPGNGGANLAWIRQIREGRTTDDRILRTRPSPRHNPPSVPEPERPYDYYVALKDYWRPFLTLDPFIFIATGERRGTLIHSYDALWK
jgi:hypothetical protein